jgi:hypothetical protein
MTASAAGAAGKITVAWRGLWWSPMLDHSHPQGGHSVKTLLLLYIVFVGSGISTQVVELPSPAACQAAGLGFQEMIQNTETVGVKFRCVPAE